MENDNSVAAVSKSMRQIVHFWTNLKNTIPSQNITIMSPNGDTKKILAEPKEQRSDSPFFQIQRKISKQVSKTTDAVQKTHYKADQGLSYPTDPLPWREDQKIFIVSFSKLGFN